MARASPGENAAGARPPGGASAAPVPARGATPWPSPLLGARPRRPLSIREQRVDLLRGVVERLLNGVALESAGDRVPKDRVDLRPVRAWRPGLRRLQLLCEDPEVRVDLRQLRRDVGANRH